MVDFSKFILSPEYFANLLSIVTEAIIDFMLLINNVVSSANWQIQKFFIHMLCATDKLVFPYLYCKYFSNQYE